MGGLAGILTRDRMQELSFSIDTAVPGHEPLKYRFDLAPKGHSYNISSEVLFQARNGYVEPFKHIESNYGDTRYFDGENGRLLTPNWDHNPLETSLSQVPKMFRLPEELRRILSSAIHYHFLDVGPRAPVKLPQQMQPAELPGVNGEDLVPFLYYLRENDHHRYQTIEDTLKSAFPTFQGMNFPPVAAGMLTMTWTDESFEKPYL